MVETTASVVAMVAMLTAGVAGRIDVVPARERVVVVHVANEAPVSHGALADAEHLATQLYHAAGVQAAWRDGDAWTAQPDGAFHVDLVILSKGQVAGRCQSDGIAEQVFGTATRANRRACVFYDRIYDHARLTASNVTRLLGAIIAHEVGHLLLPAFSHSSIGIMRAHWEGPIGHVPGFTADQGMTIRTRLAAANAR
jgi:hypothetical protein